MSASLSSLIDVCERGRPTAVDVGPAVPDDLLAAFRAVTDPRCRRGVRHQLVVVLGVAACAVLAGARSYVAIAEWAHDLPVPVGVRLGIYRNAPSESAIRRVLQAIDPHLLDATVSGWLASRAGAPSDGRRSRSTARARGGRVSATGARCICWRRCSTTPEWCSGSVSWTASPMR